MPLSCAPDQVGPGGTDHDKFQAGFFFLVVSSFMLAYSPKRKRWQSIVRAVGQEWKSPELSFPSLFSLSPLSVSFLANLGLGWQSDFFFFFFRWELINLHNVHVVCGRQGGLHQMSKLL